MSTTSKKTKILVVDDELSIVEVLRALLKREGYEVYTAPAGEEGLELLREEKFDLLITDIRMDEMDGMTLMRMAMEMQEHLAVIVMTAYATVETAVKAMRAGAFDYVCKPFKIDELLITVQRALFYELTMQENEVLKENLRTSYHFEEIVGDSDAMLRIYGMIEKVARTNSTVLIRGESGTGKELVAKALHNTSRRREKPFVAINCAALPQNLLESELFGYVKGAFTGADKFKKGLFESAEGGTLLLDEIGSLPLDMQGKLLRVLEERKIRPVGGTDNVSIDVRILAATNEDLEERLGKNEFREDLYYRLSVIPIDLPSLRERSTDVPLLVRHFLARHNEGEKASVGVDKAVLRALERYNWPGNVRELGNMISRALALCENERITLNDLPDNVQKLAGGENSSEMPARNEAEKMRGGSLKSFLRVKEKEYIEYILEECGGDKEQAAQSLGISLATFYRKLGGGKDEK